MALLAPSAPQYLPLVDSAATSAGIPTQIFEALVQSESSFNPNAQGGAGEIGLTQITPALASSMGLSASQLSDPATNLHAGASYLASLFGQFGNWSDALQAYNAGPGAVNSGSSAGKTYASGVLNLAGALGYNAGSAISNAAASGGQIDPAALASSISNGGSSQVQTSSTGIIPGAPAWLNSLLGSLSSFAVPALVIIAAVGLIIWAVLSLFKTNDGQAAAIIKEVKNAAPEAAAA